MIDVPVEVKDALRDGRLKKNYRIVVLDDEGAEDFTIDNNNLVSESVSIDERMCSGDKIKFGLCEGSSLEFQYFGFPSILGKRLQVFIDVDYGSENPYVIPMGFFDVQKCSRQASTGIIKVTAYNKLMSDYLDAKANELIDETFNHLDEVFAGDIISLLLDDYGIKAYETQTIIPYSGQTSAGREQTQKVRLKQVFGKHIFNGGVFYDTSPSTSTQLPITGQHMVRVYYLDSPYDNKIQIRVPDDFDALDDALYGFISDVFYDNFTEATATALINELVNYESSEYILRNQKKWGFGIRVVLADDTERYFGSTLYKKGIGEGTFADLNKITLSNVKEIYFSQYGHFEYIFNGFQSNILWCYGTSHIYRYAYQTPVVTSDIYTDTYYLPNIPSREGQGIPDVTNEVVVTSMLNFDGMSAEYININDLSDVTLREMQSAIFETECQFGQLDRITDLFSGVELNHSRLYPQETLYPDNALYPDGAQASATKSMYSQLWADEGNVRKWRNLLITYKGLDENQQEKDFVYTAEVNPDGTDDYDCSDNWLFRNLVWTQAQIEEYADTMVAKMQDMTWFPFEMWCAGLPYLETGDEIEIPLGQNSYTSYVLQRQLKGIQNLQDTYINGTLDIF